MEPKSGARPTGQGRELALVARRPALHDDLHDTQRRGS
jgi:hypothetical protein